MCRCIDCLHFDYWDGDWCCAAKFIIISRIDEEHCKTINVENCEKERKCSDFKNYDLDTISQKQFKMEIWKFYKR